jgi:fructose-1,6-bisphosphatase-3
MYTIYNDNLLFHGCIPLDENGDFRSSGMLGKTLSGKVFLDKIGETVRKGYFAQENSELRQNGLDLMWYLWCGSDSPLYGKNKMSVFESYFTDSKEISYEKKDSYYDFRESEVVCGKILEEFGLDKKKSRIINGHVPVKVRKGESPLKSKGRLIVIDGGFAKAYQSVTGIAGYTLIYNSQGLLLASHEPFVSKQNAIENEGDIISSTSYIEHSFERKRVRDTDNGKAILQKISELEYLITAYKQGDIIES